LGFFGVGFVVSFYGSLDKPKKQVGTLAGPSRTENLASAPLPRCATQGLQYAQVLRWALVHALSPVCGLATFLLFSGGPDGRTDVPGRDVGLGEIRRFGFYSVAARYLSRFRYFGGIINGFSFSSGHFIDS